MYVHVRIMYTAANKEYVVLSSRVHPGEANASWIMKGTGRTAMYGVLHTSVEYRVNITYRS